MATIHRLDLINTLQVAQDAGIINGLTDRNLRIIHFHTAEGQLVAVKWYVNLLTVHMPGFQMWADKVFIASSHPEYSKHLTFEYCGNSVGFIGIPYIKNGEQS